MSQTQPGRNKANQQRSSGADQDETLRPTGTARDREMGREDEPLGDLGERGVSWEPPAGEQGISNRPADGAETGRGPHGGQGMGQGRGSNAGQNQADKRGESESEDN